MRIVVDTSTVFSALAYGGKPLEVLNSIQQSDYWELVLSPEMIVELQRILSEKQKNTPLVMRALQRYFSVASR